LARNNVVDDDSAYKRCDDVTENILVGGMDYVGLHGGHVGERHDERDIEAVIDDRALAGDGGSRVDGLQSGDRAERVAGGQQGGAGAGVPGILQPADDDMLNRPWIRLGWAVRAAGGHTGCDREGQQPECGESAEQAATSRFMVMAEHGGMVSHGPPCVK